MEQRDAQTATDQGADSAVDITAVSVVLILEALNPLTINPRFLVRAQVVPGSLRFDQEQTAVTPGLSRIVYEKSHTITADPQKLTVEQAGRKLDPGHINVPGIASTLLTALDDAHCVAVGINFWGFREVSDPSRKWVGTLLRPNGDAVRHDDCDPSVDVGATYTFADRKVALNISDTIMKMEDKKWTGVLYKANCHREIPSDDSGALVRAVLDAWERDLHEFLSLAKRFSVGSKP